jgi:hypothetical protein
VAPNDLKKQSESKSLYAQMLEKKAAGLTG